MCFGCLLYLLRVDLQITLAGHPIMQLGLCFIFIPAQEGVVVWAAVPLDWRLVWNSEMVIDKPFLELLLASNASQLSC